MDTNELKACEMHRHYVNKLGSELYQARRIVEQLRVIQAVSLLTLGLLLVLFFSGCAHLRPQSRQCRLPVLVGVAPSAAKYEAEIRDAAATWNEAAQKEVFVWLGRVPFEIDDQQSGGFVNVGLAENYENANLGTNLHGYAYITSQRWCITKAAVLLIDGKIRDKVEAYNVALHELGHTIGLEHEGWGNAMSAGLDMVHSGERSWLTEHDLDALRKVVR